MEPAIELSDGCAQLRGDSIDPGQEDGPRPQPGRCATAPAPRGKKGRPQARTEKSPRLSYISSYRVVVGVPSNRYADFVAQGGLAPLEAARLSLLFERQRSFMEIVS